MKVLISTSSFGDYDKKPLEMLREAGFETVLNPHKRKLSTDELIALAKDCSGIIAGTEKYDERVFSNLPALKAISRCGAGMDGVDVEVAKKHGVLVVNTPDAPTQAVAELTIALILDSLRGITFMDKELRQSRWTKNMGHLLSGKTVGIIGLGRIGRRVAELLVPFDVKILAFETRPDAEWAAKRHIILTPLKTLLSQSEIVSIHIPYTKENHNFINKDEIGLMKKGTVLINTSRGGLVSETALFEALKRGHLGAAALDVMEKEPYDGPLKDLDNIIITPHIGSYAQESRIKMETDAVRNLLEMMHK